MYIYKLKFTLWKAEKPLRGMELQEKEDQKGQSIQEIWLDRARLKTTLSQVKGKHSIGIQNSRV